MILYEKYSAVSALAASASFCKSDILPLMLAIVSGLKE